MTHTLSIPYNDESMDHLCGVEYGDPINDIVGWININAPALKPYH
ncbi:MAG: hypothetical protein M0019_02185 [Actinomycetota bacterium]|nr:hypothetical protein [Actinomycetota bacterium]